jgi:hypothetical protein
MKENTESSSINGIYDFDVFLAAGQTVVTNRHTAERLYQSSDAAEALQYALDGAALEGGSVTLGSGRYRLPRPIHVDQDVLLRGSGRSTKLEVIPENTEGTGIIIQDVHGAQVSDLCLTSGDNPAARNGLIIDNCSDVKIRNLFAIRFEDYGLWMRNHTFLSEVSSCTFAGNKKANIFGDNLNWGKVGNFIPNLISNCTIYGGGKGIEFNYVIVMNVVGCNIYQTKGIGIHLYNQCNSVAIMGCRTFQVDDDAVVVSYSHELNVTANVFCWSTGNGMVINDCAWGVVSGNEVIDNGSFNPGGVNFTTKFEDLKDEVPLKTGIILDHTRGYTVSNNTIFNWNLAPKMKYGIHEHANCFKNIIQGNNINYFNEEGVRSEGAESIVKDNVMLEDVTHAEVGDYSQRIHVAGPFKKKEWCQSFQQELTDELIDGLK